MSDIADFLGALGLDRLVELFERNEVDLDTLLILTEADLDQLGVGFGPRKKILHAIAARATPDATAPAQRERRHLTVMFCDMVGFTELAGRLDPEVLETVVRAYEDVCASSIAHYGGYVYERLGDGIIAFFGYPRAHEREAERAIHTGLEILERLAELDVEAVGRIEARVGIASGVVLVSPADHGATGETMNLAARLQTVALPGTIAISGRVHRLAGDAFEYTDLGHLPLKGITEPVHTFRVEGQRDGDGRFADESGPELVGRRPEIELLLSRWRASRGGRGSVTCLVGEAGIGKSRIVSELGRAVLADGGVPVVAQCSPYHQHSAYHPIADALRRLLAVDGDASPDAALDALTALCGRYGRGDDVALLAGVLGVPTGDRFEPVGLAPRDLKDRTVGAVVDLVAAVAGELGTVLLVEDLHWSDPSTLDVLDVLVGRAEGIGAQIVTTQRPDAPVRWATSSSATVVELGRLADAEVRRMIAALGGRSLQPDIVDLVVDRADGIPLFVEELTVAVLDRAAAANAVATAEVRALPHTLRDLLAARLDQLGAAKAVAQLGSVIGRDVPLDLLRAIADEPAERVDALLEDLHRSGLAIRHDDGSGAWFTFKHALVRDAAYEGMTRVQRQELHGRVADVLVARPLAAEPEIIGHHLSAAGRAAEALPFWREAGRSALRRFALAEAVAHFSSGLALIGELPPGTERDIDELQLRSEAAPALVAVRGWAAPDVAELLTPAVALADQLGGRLGHHQTLLPVLHGLWVHHMSAAQHDEGVGWAQQLLRAAHELDDEVLELCGHRSMVASHFWRGDLATSLAHGDRIREVYRLDRHRHIVELTNADPFTGEGSYRCQALWMLGRPDEAVEISDEKDEFARRRNHPFDLCFALTVGALAFDYRGEPDALLARADEAMRVGREHRVPLMSEMMAQIVLGIGWLRAGRPDDAAHQIAVSLERLRGTGHRAWVPYVHAVLGEAIGAAGDPHGGIAEVGRAIGMMRDNGELVHLPEALRLDGVLRVRCGDRAAGEASLRHSIEVADAHGARGWSLRSATTLAELLLADGDAGAAVALVEPRLRSIVGGADTADHRRAIELLARADHHTRRTIDTAGAST